MRTDSITGEVRLYSAIKVPERKGCQSLKTMRCGKRKPVKFLQERCDTVVMSWYGRSVGQHGLYSVQSGPVLLLLVT